MKQPTPKEKAEEIIKEIFRQQHVDDSAKMICISTPRIAEYMVEQILKTAFFWKMVK